jgi:DNA-binding FrmR family transcriptional regulator
VNQDINTKNQIVLNLSQLECQIQNIKRMIIDKESCDDILNQVSSIQSELISVNKLMIKNHVTNRLLEDTNMSNQSVIEVSRMIDLIIK